MGKQAPPAPDYQGAAQKTADANMANNRPNTANPYSQQTTNPDGSISVGFSGPMAGVNAGLQGQLAQALGGGLDFSQLGAMPNGEAARQQAIDAAYGQATSRLDPQWEKRESMAQTQLLNQGLDPSSEAAQSAMSQLGQQRNDAYTSAMNSAIGQGTAASQAMFGQQMASRQQMLAEMLRQRGQPLSEMQALQGFLQQPGFNQVQAPDYLGAAAAQGNYDLNAWNSQNAANGQIWGNLFGLGGSLGGAAIMASDERLKNNVMRETAEALPGVPFASWEYKGFPGVRFRGVVAQDLARVAPEYVVTMPSGFMAVRYGELSKVVANG